jgi:RNA polymerase sigma-70 factor, ECF subfamily
VLLSFLLIQTPPSKLSVLGMPASNTAPSLTGANPAAAAVPDNRIRAIVEREYAAVWRFLRRLGVPASQVDDAAQGVFARVLAREHVVEAGAERAYLMKAAFHISFECRRARQRSAARASEFDVEALEDVGLEPEQALLRREQRRQLDAALDALPADLRAIFTLFELEGLTFSEIALALELPRGTVASRVRRARELFLQAAARLQKGRTK